MKSIALVVVRGGVADVYQPNHVDCIVVDLDNVDSEDAGTLTELPNDVGFDQLVADAGLVEGVDFKWETK